MHVWMYAHTYIHRRADTGVYVYAYTYVYEHLKSMLMYTNIKLLFLVCENFDTSERAWFVQGAHLASEEGPRRRNCHLKINSDYMIF